MHDQPSSPQPAGSSTKQQAEALYVQLVDCFEANYGGASNPDALRRMESLGLHMKWSSNCFAEKIGSLLSWAAILYSPGKHRAWDQGAGVSGVEQIRSFMLQDLWSMQDILRRMPD